MNTPILQTKRLTLRKFAQADVEAIFQISQSFFAVVSNEIYKELSVFHNMETEICTYKEVEDGN